MPLINHSVLMSDAEHFSTDQHINPYYDDKPVDLDGAKKEHQNIVRLFQRAGIEVQQQPSPENSQDGVYTANWALVRGMNAVLASLPDARKAEEPYAEKILSDMGFHVVKVPEGLKFSGQGDALAAGEYLFCGKGYRSDEEAQKFAADYLKYTRIQLQTVPQLNSDGESLVNPVSGWADSFFYDLDLALSILKAPTHEEKGLIAYCREAFMPESQEILAHLDDFDTILMTLEEATEAFAANLVSTGEKVIMSRKAPRLAREIGRRGLEVVSPKITELVKGGGYIRCVSLTLA